MKIYVFKITNKADAKNYKIIEVPENMSLYNFANKIVKSFHFDFDHSFGFSSNLINFYKPAKKLFELFTDLDDVEHTPGAKGVKKYFISDAFDNQGDKMLFLFDYGDNWEFIIECIVNSQQVVNASGNYFKLIEFHGDDPEQYPDYDEED